ncbi:MAG: eukaryotic-like serine/threonine-protein kinase [Solirubrobacteraceae bacterium]|nr:eukaryotic-like serine/threonine-protein kinase [Solirubrobacteraceae bacterium]
MDREGKLVAAAAAGADAGRLRDRLAEIESEQAALEAELAAFDADYVRQVVTVMAQFHEAEARLLRLVAERSGAAGDARAADEARARARETTAEVRAVPAPAPPVPTGEIKKLFRDAAKRMHPDLAPDDDARVHAEAFMKRLNHAYRAGDAEAIADLLRQWEASPFAADPSVSPDARRVTALGAAVARAERRLAEVRESDLAQLMERAMAAAVEGRDLLAELRADAVAALAAARARLASLEAAES